MTNTRELFLQRVRQAVVEGNRAGAVAALESRGKVGYQGAGPDPLRRFCAELTATGGHPHVVTGIPQAVACTLDLVRACSARNILVGNGPLLESLELPANLEQHGCAVTMVRSLSAGNNSEPFFKADLGISDAQHVIAETGTVVVASRPGEPRSLSLLPPAHIVLAHRSQLLADLFDLFALYGANDRAPQLPSCLSLITGPSKTGDIELRLVTGVHGPGEVHVIMVNG